LLQDDRTLGHFTTLGISQEKLQVIGALKGSAKPLPFDQDQVRVLKQAIGDRFVWLAATSELREHADLLEAHHCVQKELADSLFIIAPRNLQDADAIQMQAELQFQNVARRSKGEIPDQHTQVYIAGTLGEMGLWYSLSTLAFIGHSLPVSRAPLRGKKNRLKLLRWTQ